MKLMQLGRKESDMCEKHDNVGQEEAHALYAAGLKLTYAILDLLGKHWEAQTSLDSSTDVYFRYGCCVIACDWQEIDTSDFKEVMALFGADSMVMRECGGKYYVSIPVTEHAQPEMY